MKEEWIEIIGFPNYEISNLGRVKSRARIVYRSGNACFLKEVIKKPKIEKWDILQ